MKKKLADCTMREITNLCHRRECRWCELYGEDGCILSAELPTYWVKIDIDTYESFTIEEIEVEI